MWLFSLAWTGSSLRTETIFFVALGQLAPGEFYMALHVQIHCNVKVLVCFPPQISAAHVKTVLCVWSILCHPSLGRWIVYSHRVFSSPPGWQSGIKGKLWSIFGRINNCHFSFLYKYCFYVTLYTPSPWTDVLTDIVGCIFVLKILKHYWKRRGLGEKKKNS